jgi:hypothetical protein
VNGAGADPLFDYLKSEKAGIFGSTDIKWNCEPSPPAQPRTRPRSHPPALPLSSGTAAGGATAAARGAAAVRAPPCLWRGPQGCPPRPWPVAPSPRSLTLSCPRLPPRAPPVSKFLVNKEGDVVGRYAPTTTPGSLEKEIQKLLAA